MLWSFHLKRSVLPVLCVCVCFGAFLELAEDLLYVDICTCFKNIYIERERERERCTYICISKYIYMYIISERNCTYNIKTCMYKHVYICNIYIWVPICIFSYISYIYQYIYIYIFLHSASALNPLPSKASKQQQPKRTLWCSCNQPSFSQ